MPAFQYRALNPSGKLEKGLLEGDSEKQIRGQLRAKQLKPVEVKQVEGQAKAGKGFSLEQLFKPRIKSADLAMLTRQLATLVQSGLPLDEALAAAAEQSQKNRVKSLLMQVRSRVVEGHTLAHALAESPQVFNELYRSMVKAGEHAGFLGIVLDRLADYTENRQVTQQQLQQAMIYPFILVSVAFVVIALLMAFVVPKLVSVFTSSGAELPQLTKMLIASSEFVQSYGFISIILGIVSLIALQRILAIPKYRQLWHHFLLQVPIISGMYLAMDTARFASTLSILVSSGVPLLDGLKIAGQVLTNIELRKSSEQVALDVFEGSSLNKALKESGKFPPMMVHMVASGEVSGQLVEMLDRSALNQERELQMKLKTIMAIMEPALLVVMASAVTAIVFAVLLPIFDLNKLVT